ncbi:MAG: hypothetical protein IH986_13170 [Planctomycetes bacterium]|nr:hypothetical protein [Planctomycetota bacterium]
MEGIEMLTETERLLLMAAGVHGLGPNTDLSCANTARVVDQALRWLGLTAEEIRRGLNEPECHPVSEEVYNVLVRMTHQTHRDGPGPAPERPGKALFEGGGNWGVPGDASSPPAWPHFNSCRLTAHGERIALELLEQHPEYREKG